MAALLEPAVEVEHPVDRLHPVVREEEHGRLLAVLRLGCVDQLAAQLVDALVDPEELVAGAGRSPCAGCSGSKRAKPRWPTWSVLMKSTREQAEIRLQLEDELADAGHLLGVLDAAARV